ncbi:MAG: MTH1187 family thiamine-binding protein [Thermoprotei archaeon]
MKVVVDLAVEPIGTGSTSISEYVRTAIEVLKRNGLKVYPSPSMTSFELDDLTKLGYILKQVNDELEKKGVKRIVMILKIDDRRDKETSIEHKLQAVS